MRNIYFLLCVYATFITNGCSASQEHVLQSTQSKDQKNLAVSSGKPYSKTVKPGASVGLGSPSVINILPNQTSKVNVIFTTNIGSGTMEIEIFPDKHVELMNTKSVQNFTITQANEFDVPMNILAVKNGRFYMNFHITLTADGMTSHRNLAVIVQVGSLEESQIDSNKLLEKPTKEKLILMPVQETIIENE